MTNITKAAQTSTEPWSFWEALPGHLIDKYDGATLTEELLQEAAASLHAKLRAEQPARQDPCSGPLCGLPEFGEHHPLCNLHRRAALQDKAGEVRIPAAGPSTYEQRFSEAIRLLTHASPPADMVASWLDHTSEDLQHWIGSQKGTPEWAQSLAITDAAHAIAISPIEGEQHDFEPPAAQPAPVVPDDVARDAGWFRLIRDGSGWPAVFASHDAPEPLRGDDLDAAMIAASQQNG